MPAPAVKRAGCMAWQFRRPGGAWSHCCSVDERATFAARKALLAFRVQRQVG